MNHFHKRQITQQDGYNNLLLAIVYRAVLDAQALAVMTTLRVAASHCQADVAEMFDSAKRVKSISNKRKHHARPRRTR